MRFRYGLAFLAMIACQQVDHPSQPPAPTKARSASSAKADDRIVVDGLVVEMLDGGAIKLTGKDRWGNAIDTTYENAEFLRKALPVLTRGLTLEQALELRVIVGQGSDAAETSP